MRSQGRFLHVAPFKCFATLFTMLCAIAAIAPAAAPIEKPIDHTFSFKLPDGATKPQSVNVAGDFNGWSATKNAMRAKDGIYTTTVKLTPGLHSYKFVLNGSTWIEDPAADVALEQDDGNGGKNSAVLIGAKTTTAPTGTPSATPEADSAAGHRFTFTPAPADPKPTSVNIAGDFNGWNTTATPMQEKDGVFSVIVKLTPGTHAYKFVINGTDWKNDPSADAKLNQDDGNGGANSAVVISDAKAPTPAAAASDGGHVFIYKPSAADAKPDSVHLAGDFNGWSTTATPMQETNGSYSASVTLSPGTHYYKFVVNGSDWKNDPLADPALDQDDGNQGHNSGVKIGGDVPPPPHAEAPAPPAADRREVAAMGGIHYVHEFYFHPAIGSGWPRTVAVGGDFNAWNSAANPMSISDGAFRTTVPLAEGVHHYKFMVDGQWMPDPMSDASVEESDGFGGNNSAVLIGPDGRKLPPPQPDAINLTAIGHDPQDTHDCNVIDSTHVRLGVRCQADDVRSINVLIRQLNGRWSSTPLYKVQSSAGIDRFATVISTPQVDSIRYCFELVDGSAKTYLGASDSATTIAQAQDSAFSILMKPTFETPDWAKHVVWYQIFPERFRNGEKSNDPPNTMKWTADWWSQMPGETDRFYDKVYQRRFGGDFQGIQQELPYLRSLGITAIYLNPIFKAESLHKYDTSDYRHVDDYFGFKGDVEQLSGETEDPATWQWTKTDKLFLDFVAEAHRQGFKIILDGVFNHTGKGFFAFQDVMKNGKNSRYADWYRISSWEPFHWQGWGGSLDGELPEFRKDDTLGLVHGPRELIMNISKRWLAPNDDPSRGVDGFRLDAAENVPHAFWADWRKLCKSVKPDALLDGEIWTIAPGWLSGDQFDCTMDYPFATAMEQFFVDQEKATTPTQFSKQLGTLTMAYPFQVMLAEQNLLDSHDTDRWASRFVNPDLGFNQKSRMQENPNYNKAKPGKEEWTRIEQSLVVQFTYAGAPMIYYGDEAGMWGASDPTDRQPMIWKDLEPYDNPEETFNQPLFDQYQKLIAIHAARPELQLGFPHPLLLDDGDGVFSFARDLDEHHTAVIVNRNATTHEVTINFGPDDRDVKLIDLLDGSTIHDLNEADARPTIIGGATVVATHGRVKVKLQPWGSAILAGDWK